MYNAVPVFLLGVYETILELALFLAYLTIEVKAMALALA
jgi:hypothetical protein